MIRAGIDLHATNMVIVAINDNGEVVREAKLPTSPTRLAKFFSTLDRPVKAVVECTSNWYWLIDWCRANGVDLTLAHAKMVKAISYVKVKTDKVDAKTLAELLRADLIPEALPGKARTQSPAQAHPRTVADDPVAGETAIHALGAGSKI